MSLASELFASLALPPTASSVLTAVGFPGHSSHRIAKNDKGQAVVLVASTHDSTRLVALPVRTEHLSVVYSTEYSIQHPTGELTRAVYSAITCLDDNPAFIRYFFSVVSGLLDIVGPDPATGEVVRVVRAIVELFRSLTLASSATVQGLWAELFVIAESRNGSTAACAWRSVPHERYDFALGSERLDVKSSSARERRHHFSHSQLTPPDTTSLWIVSLFAERSSGGVSLETMIGKACTGLPPDEATRIRSLAAETLGSGFASALEVAFDYELAKHSLRYFNGREVPRLLAPIPAEISNVRFISDLSHCAAIDVSGSASQLLAALPTSAS